MKEKEEGLLVRQKSLELIEMQKHADSAAC